MKECTCNLILLLETLQKKYVGKLSKRALGFIRQLLAMEPTDRPSAQECLSNIYFENLDKKFNMHVAGYNNASGNPTNSNAAQTKEKDISPILPATTLPSAASNMANGSSNVSGNVESPLTHWPQIQVHNSNSNMNAGKQAKQTGGIAVVNNSNSSSLPQQSDSAVAEMKLKFKAQSKVCHLFSPIHVIFHFQFFFCSRVDGCIRRRHSKRRAKFQPHSHSKLY